MQYVLDTNVVSALRIRGRNPAVEAWARSIAMTDQFVSAFTLAEIERGVIVKERSDRLQGKILRRWFEQHVLPAFAGRVLPFDQATAHILAAYPVPDHAPLDDAIIAATAQSRTMQVATRNTRHFTPLGVACVNPWEFGEE